MIFNSVHFFIFFGLVTVAYFTLPPAWRLVLLFLASCYFYMALIPQYILILFLLIGIDYWAGIEIESASGRKRKVLLWLSLFANVGVLSTFKYYNFFSENVVSFFRHLGVTLVLPRVGWALPIGLSFHTFQSMSYTIEVYKGRQKAEHNLLIYSLYVLFYPQLVAGPIERPQHLLHQFREGHALDWDRITSGLRLMALGLFKKVVVADGLASFINPIYSRVRETSPWLLALATFSFSFQILFDFSGYTDIARGAAKVMGFDLMENFMSPYRASSVREFWRRWHISLSTWFRDYLYFTLGGDRVGRFRWILNLLVVFLVSGLWHGANWTFVTWGALHGAYMVLGETFGRLWSRRPNFAQAKVCPSELLVVLSVGWTFFWVSIAWVFFRAVNLEDALWVVRSIFSLPSHFSFLELQVLWHSWHKYHLYCVAIIGAVLLMMGAAFWRTEGTDGFERAWASTAGWGRWAIYVGILLALLNFGTYETLPFIYFQF